MNFKCSSVSLIPAGILVVLISIMTQSVAHSAEAAKTVAIVANDTLRFSVTTIKASPGETIHVQLLNKGTIPKAVMGHNWILLDGEAEANSYATAALSAREDNYQPKALASHVLAVIPLLGPGEVGDVTFHAPTTPGQYPFICSFPGHFSAGMRGELIVK